MAFQKAKAIANAQRFIKRGQFKKAIGEYQRVVRADPGDIRSQLKLGDLHIKVQDYDAATATLRTVAQHYTEQGFTLKAVAVYKQILRINPELGDVALSLARHYQQLGLLNDAIAQFKQAARLFDNQGRSNERLEVIKQMLELDPENVADRIRLAEEFSAAGRIKEAVALFRTVCGILRDRDRLDLYRPVAERLLHHAPQDVEANKTLATYHLQNKDAQRAFPRLEVCFQANPEDLEVLDMLQQAFDLMGQPHKAITVLKEMARIYDQNGLQAERDQIYEQVLVLDGEDESARQALNVVEEIGEDKAEEFELDHSLSEGGELPVPESSEAEFAELEEQDRSPRPAPPVGPPPRPGRKPPAAATKPPPVAAKPPPVAAKPPPVAAKPPAAAAKPPPAAAKPPAAAAKPPPVAAKPPPVAARPPAAKPPPAAAKPPPAAAAARPSGSFTNDGLDDIDDDRLAEIDLDEEIGFEEGEATVVDMKPSDFDEFDDFKAELEQDLQEGPKTGARKRRRPSASTSPAPESLKDLVAGDEGAFSAQDTGEEVDLDELMASLESDDDVSAAGGRAEGAGDKASDALREGLQEVDFYIANELHQDALQLLRELEQDHPGNAEINKRIKQLTAS